MWKTSDATRRSHFQSLMDLATRRGGLDSLTAKYSAGRTEALRSRREHGHNTPLERSPYARAT